MSVLRRPHGDQIAKKFGEYMAEADISKLAPGDKFEVLCEGGIHYVAKLVQIDNKLNGKLHFCKWNEKFDHQGSIRELYITSVGTYSTGTLNGANQYIDPNDTSMSRKSHTKQSITKSGAGEDGSDMQTYAEKTRYDNDYLFKPYRSDRKRRARDGAADNNQLEASVPLSEPLERSEGPPSTKKAKIDEAAGLQQSGERGRGEESPRRSNPPEPVPAPQPAASVRAPAPAVRGTVIQSTAPVRIIAPMSATSSIIAPSTAATRSDTHSGQLDSEPAQNQVIETGVSSNGSVDNSCAADGAVADCNGGDEEDGGQLEEQEQVEEQVPVGGSQSGASTGEERGSASEGPSAQPSHPALSLRPSPQQALEVEYVAAPNPLVVAGGRAMARWRYFFRQMLLDSGDPECVDVAKAMEWLDRHMDALRQRGTIRGKVYGPLAVVCVTRDVSSAVMLEHAIGRDKLLGFLVDRLLDQQYLEEQLVNKQGLKVKVLFSGTRDRFNGYKPLPSVLTRPLSGCALTNLGDRLLCGQLIRNLLHSEGVTGQYVLGGSAAVGIDVTAALKGVFSRAGREGVVYIAQSAVAKASAADATSIFYRYTIGEDGDKNRLHAEEIPMVGAMVSSSSGGGSKGPRLLYSYAEQLGYAETVPVHLVAATAFIPPAPSLSNHHSASASSAKSQPAGLGGDAVSHALLRGSLYVPIDPFLGLAKYDADRLEAVLAARASGGLIAVWHLLSRRAGVWMTEKGALGKESGEAVGAASKVAQGAGGAQAHQALPSVDSAGYFVPLKAFLEGLDVLGCEEAVRFGETWPLSPQPWPPAISTVREASIAVPDSLRNSAAEESGDNVGDGEVAVDKKVDAVQNSAEPTEDQDVMEVVEVEEDEAVAENETIKAREEGESEVGVEGGVGDGKEGGAHERATAYTPLPMDPLPLNGTLTPIDGSALDPTAAGDGDALECPHLALHKKHSELGLAFLTRNAFIAWHSAVAPGGTMDEVPQIDDSRVAFLTLSSLAGNREYYDLRLLKRKHTVLFSATEPDIARVLQALLQRNRDAALQQERFQRSSADALSGTRPIVPLPLSVLTDTLQGISQRPTLHGSSSNGHALLDSRGGQQRYGAVFDVPKVGIGAAPGATLGALPLVDVKYFKSQLGNDAIIGSLVRSLVNLTACAPELTRQGVDVECLRRLLTAQLQLARATRLMLK